MLAADLGAGKTRRRQFDTSWILRTSTLSSLHPPVLPYAVSSLSHMRWSQALLIRSRTPAQSTLTKRRTIVCLGPWQNKRAPITGEKLSMA